MCDNYEHFNWRIYGTKSNEKLTNKRRITKKTTNELDEPEKQSISEASPEGIDNLRWGGFVERYVGSLE